MPEGPFGLPRITDYGPFVDVELDREDIEIIEEEKLQATPLDATDTIPGFPRRANYVSIEAVYDSRGIKPESEESKRVRDIIGMPDSVFRRQAGFSNYYYSGKEAWSTKTRVNKELRNVGLGSELMSQKIESMRSRGVEEVWAIGATSAGRALLEKHGFRRVDEHDNMYTRVIR